MTAYNTSRVFEAARKMKERLNAQGWPSHPTTGDEPQVAFTDVDLDGQGELVWIIPDFGDDAEITWRSMPNGRDEEFDIVIKVISDALVTDEFDEDNLLDRLEQLADVVQRAFYDDNGELTASTDRISPLGIDAAVKLEGVNQVAFVIVPGGDNLLHGEATIRYRTAFRI